MTPTELPGIRNGKISAFSRWRPAAEAARMKSAITTNMLVLGAYLKVKPVVDLENVIKGLQKSLPQRHHHLIPKNEAAIKRGMEIVREAKLTS